MNDTTNPMGSTPATGLIGMPSSFAASVHSAFTAPKTWEQGSGLPVAGTYAAAAATTAQAASAGVRVPSLTASPPRGAPV